MTPHTVTAPGRRPRRHSDLHLTLASIAAGVALLLAGTYPMSVGAQVGGGGTQVGVSPEAGPPYPWEAGVMVSPYSTANLFNGNVLTAIQLVEPLESVGVPFRLTLYHNSAGASGSLTPPQGALFPIGSGWNITFGGCVIDQTAQNKMYVIEDDGLVKLFNWNGSQWVPPTGVHERLERDDMGTPSDPGDDHWVLTRKDQRQRVFSANGLLIEERSSNLQFGGLPAPMYREPDSKYISKIAVWPDYNVDPLGGLFWSITYPANSTDPINIRLRTKELWARQIRLSRNEQGRLDKVEWLDEQQEAGPPAVYAHVELTYDSAGRIQTIRDKNGNTY
ncbi:MAG: hypothetical protein HZB38_09640, partial [Planctomycetes bacterium]|nr:hypothetical protein [Planctomycetota bacterium]